MAPLIAIMVAGFLTGWAVRGRTRLLGRLGALTRPVIFGLLFLMGVSLGLDAQTMGNVAAIGLTSLGFAVLTILGSMAVLALVLPLLRHIRLRPAGADAADPAALARESQREGEALVR